MAVPIVLSFLVKMAARFGIAKARQMVVKKYGKDALRNITKKVVTKSKPVKKVTELQRVKAQIKRDKLNPRLKVKQPTGKVVGKVRQNYGEWKPYTRPVKPASKKSYMERRKNWLKKFRNINPKLKPKK